MTSEEEVETANERDGYYDGYWFFVAGNAVVHIAIFIALPAYVFGVVCGWW